MPASGSRLVTADNEVRTVPVIGAGGQYHGWPPLPNLGTRKLDPNNLAGSRDQFPQQAWIGQHDSAHTRQDRRHPPRSNPREHPTQRHRMMPDHSRSAKPDAVAQQPGASGCWFHIFRARSYLPLTLIIRHHRLPGQRTVRRIRKLQACKTPCRTRAVRYRTAAEWWEPMYRLQRNSVPFVPQSRRP